MMTFVWIGAIIVFGIVEAATAGLVSIWFVVGSVAALLAAAAGLGTLAQIVLLSLIHIYGFDAYKEEYCDMVSAGIIDPAKVTRSALENAASVSSMVLTTESLVADKPEPPAPAPAAPDMGGMY